MYLIKRSIECLEERAAHGLDSALATGMICKVFSSLVDYRDAFKGLREAVLHNDELEATAKVRFRTPRGGFHCNPMWIDSCGQTTGFLMNCHQSIPSDYVYVNHGWGSMRLAKEFREDATYRTYIRMNAVDDTKYAGDLYILDDSNAVVGVFGDITFQGLPRRVLNMVMPQTRLGPIDAHQGRREGPDSSATHALPSATAGDRALPNRSVISLPPAVDSSSNSQLRPLLRILSEEIGLSPEALSDDELDFADHDVDSLLSLTITGRMREDLGIDVDSSTFLTCPTLGHFKSSLGFGSPGRYWRKHPQDVSELDTATPPTSDGEQSEHEYARSGKPATNDSGSSSSQFLRQFRATSTLLQGSPKKARSILFLLPDGSGSATSYASLPPISQQGDVAVYGLNCPWLKTPKYLVEFGLKSLAELYVDEILRRQPQGPYALGGWSAGGICAYEPSLLLTKAGNEVNRLILIDSPGPIGLEKLPPRLYEFLDAKNIFGSENPHGVAGGGTKAPEWLLAHFRAFVDALDAYVAVPRATALLDSDGGRKQRTPPPPPPQTFVLWAEDGVCKNASDPRPEYRADDPREMRWLLENRTNFGPNSWDALLGGTGTYPSIESLMRTISPC
ncbi:polyketide synthase [Colletotrichum tofieldiae]|nr:polyketide synthase [Colletotrichum tofieldiae]